MFRIDPKQLKDLLHEYMRDNDLEMPLLRKRAVDAWDIVAGPVVAQATTSKRLDNQTLFVTIANAALRSDLMYQRSELVRLINESVGAFVISEIKIM